MKISISKASLAVLLAATSLRAETALEYAASPPDNPLRGLVPYVEIDGWERFPHSLEFHYFALRDLMTGYESFDWSPVEEKLAVAQSRGCQMVVRVMMEYPGRPVQIPQFLIDEGVAITEWTREAADGGECHTPDYEDPRLRRALRNFIAAFGEKYDGDPRLGCVTAGLLGSWGEWHTHPRTELMASKETQEIVMTAYEKAFTRIPVLLRYPAGENHYAYAKNSDRRFGYHDDSFAWATLGTGKPEDNWFYLPALAEAGAKDKWKTQPIGGEIRPELWETSFTGQKHPQEQDFAECVEQTHVSWLMDTGLFSLTIPLSDDRKKTAIQAIQRMGYEFHVAKWKREGKSIEITVENRGVAPFYHDWQAELHAGEEVVARFDLHGILPGDSSVWKAETKSDGPFRLRVPNPMPGGKPLRFANVEQDGEWLVLP